MCTLSKLLKIRIIIKFLFIYAASSFFSAHAAQSNIEIAEQYQSEGNQYKALYYYQVALSEDKENVEALYGIAEIEYKKGRFDSALKRLNVLINKDSSNLKGLILRGKVLAKQQRWNEAISNLREAELLDNDSASVQSTLDSIYTSMGDDINAKKSAERYRELMKRKKNNATRK